jgi:hypothetical protein
MIHHILIGRESWAGEANIIFNLLKGTEKSDVDEGKMINFASFQN